MAEDADVDIQPITRADFVPAKVFRSRSMNTLPAQQTVASKDGRAYGGAPFHVTESEIIAPEICNMILVKALCNKVHVLTARMNLKVK